MEDGRTGKVRRGRKRKAAAALATAALLLAGALTVDAYSGRAAPPAAPAGPSAGSASSVCEDVRPFHSSVPVGMGNTKRKRWSTAGSTGTVYNARSGRHELVYPQPWKLAVVIGDSQAEGGRRVPGTKTWPQRALVAAGYTPVFRGRGGTGFAAPGSGTFSYSEALRREQWLLPHGDVGLVLVEGGGNDATKGESDAAIRRGVLTLVEELRKSYPSGRIIVVGTLAKARNDGGGRRNEVNALVGSAAREAGADFVSVGNWLTKYGLAEYLQDRVHLTAEGHRVAGRILGAQLRELGVGAPAPGPVAVAPDCRVL